MRQVLVQHGVLDNPWVKLFVIAGGAAAGVTKTTDMIRNLIDPNGRLVKWLWNVVPLGLAFAAAFVFHLNLAPQAGLNIAMWAGELVTGIAVAGAAGGWHELFDLLSSHAKKARAVAAGTSIGATGQPKVGDTLR